MSKIVTYNGKAYTKSSELFDRLVNHDDMTRDQAIIAAVIAGMTLNTATQHYAKWARAEGLTTALVSHKKEALDYLTDTYGGDFTLENALEAIPVLVEKFSVAESTARDYAKAYCEGCGVDYPVVNPREAIFNWFKGNESVTKEDFMTFAVEGLGRSQSNANEYWKGYELHLFLVG